MLMGASVCVCVFVCVCVRACVRARVGVCVCAWGNEGQLNKKPSFPSGHNNKMVTRGGGSSIKRLS